MQSRWKRGIRKNRAEPLSEVAASVPRSPPPGHRAPAAVRFFAHQTEPGFLVKWRRQLKDFILIKPEAA